MALNALGAANTAESLRVYEPSPSLRSSDGQRKIYNSAPELWNKLPRNMREAQWTETTKHLKSVSLSFN